MPDPLLGFVEVTRTVSPHETVAERFARHSRTYHCRCGAILFFGNTQCLTCGSLLGYLADEGRIAALDPAPEPDVWRTDGRPEPLKCCEHRQGPGACNWMMHAQSEHRHCLACRLNLHFPDLSDPAALRDWPPIEEAKRRLVSQLLAMGLPVRSKVEEDPEHGVAFNFLRSPAEGPQVLTGHANGLITINMDEADDAKREAIRVALHEPYRTLLGHFRHEIGHYYWDRLVWDTKWLERFRALFGDERASYAEALRRNYEQGPPADWPQAYISAYASTHPWEDWAETWAHYMHVVDTLGTAMGYGVDLERDEGRVRAFGPEALYAPDHPFADSFLRLVNAWSRVTLILNELARAMGQPDFYPFVMSAPVVAKLQFVQMVIGDARTASEL